MKRRLIQTGILFLGFLFATGCAREFYDISWLGVVADKETKKPIPHASVWATCSYQENIDQTGEIQKYTLSDEYGRFSLNFPRGFGLRVNATAMDYLSFLDYKVIKKASLADTIYISRHPFNASLVVRMKNRDSFSPGEPFIRQIIVTSQGREDKKSVEYKGFDFFNGINTSELDSADVWVEINQNNGQIVLKTSSKGGIFPVYKQEYTDFLTRVTRAPENGYVRSYQVNGQEAGFFVLCRDGTHLAKMIPQDHLFQLNYSVESKLVSETGIRFDYLFQPDPLNRFSFPVSASSANPTKEYKEVSINSISTASPLK